MIRRRPDLFFGYVIAPFLERELGLVIALLVALLVGPAHQVK